MARSTLLACMLALAVAPAAGAATYAPAAGHVLNGVAGGYSVSDYVAHTGAAPAVVQSFVAYNGSTNWACVTTGNVICTLPLLGTALT